MPATLTSIIGKLRGFRLVQLSWSNQADIAATLFKAYPDTDRLSLSRDQLLQLIVCLPDFKDTTSPPQPACLDHILWTWMRLADSDIERAG
jgi:FeS assembly protein IscX